MYMLFKEIKHYKTKENEIYTAKITHNGKKFDITFNSLTNNIIIHQWYSLAQDELENMKAFLISSFNQLLSGLAIKC